MYERFHQNRTNLLIHLGTVPLFMAGTIIVITGIVTANWLWCPAGFVLLLFSLAAQGYGHRQEPNPPEPFQGAGNFLARIFREQFFTFPLFVLSGKWWQAWQGTIHPNEHPHP